MLFFACKRYLLVDGRFRGDQGLFLVVAAILRSGCGSGVVVPFLGWEMDVF